MFCKTFDWIQNLGRWTRLFSYTSKPFVQVKVNVLGLFVKKHFFFFYTIFVSNCIVSFNLFCLMFFLEFYSFSKYNRSPQSCPFDLGDEKRGPSPHSFSVSHSFYSPFIYLFFSLTQSSPFFFKLSPPLALLQIGLTDFSQHFPFKNPACLRYSWLGYGSIQDSNVILEMFYLHSYVRTAVTVHSFVW